MAWSPRWWGPVPSQLRLLQLPIHVSDPPGSQACICVHTRYTLHAPHSWASRDACRNACTCGQILRLGLHALFDGNRSGWPLEQLRTLEDVILHDPASDCHDSVLGRTLHQSVRGCKYRFHAFMQVLVQECPLCQVSNFLWSGRGKIIWVARGPCTNVVAWGGPEREFPPGFLESFCPCQPPSWKSLLPEISFVCSLVEAAVSS